MNVHWTNLIELAWTQLWQVTLLVVVVAILAHLVGRNRPHLAYALWLVVLVKCVMPPVFDSASGIFCWLQPVEQAATRTAAASLDSTPITGLSHEPAELIVSLYPIEAMQTGPAEPVGMVESTSSWFSLGRVAVFGLAIWAFGATVSLGWSVWQWRACLRTVRRERAEGNGELEQAVLRLAQQLGLRRPIRVIVTQGRLGPAVTGVFRPALLMPEGMLVGKTPSELEPILVHELIHIRRGDLWAGLLQTVVLALWWFHPLVRWAVRESMGEAERCCDEAVLVELDCQPKQYARSLLDVLQYKTEWAPAPAFPGAGRIDATAKRLERIMGLREGCRRRSPWWCWLVMLAMAVLVLPGGAFVVSAEKDPENQAVLETPTAVPISQAEDQITRAELARECLRLHGDEVLKGVTRKMLIDHECRKQGILISDEEVDAEIERMAKRFRLSADRWLELLRDQRNITPARYSDDIVYPTLALRKLVEDQLTVDADDLRVEYDKRYGAAANVRFVDAMPILEEAVRESKFRTEAAKLLSELEDEHDVVLVFNDPAKQKGHPGVAAFVDDETVTLRELAELCVERHGVEIRQRIALERAQ